MFSVYARGRKRRLWSTKTILVSVGAHVFVFTAAATAAGNKPEATEEPILNVTYTDIAAERRVKPPPPPPPSVPTPQRPEFGDHRRIEHVTVIPTELPEIDPRAHFDSSEYNRPGEQPGEVIVDNPPQPVEPVDPGSPAGGDGPLGVDMVEERPSLVNRAESERLLRRYYPSLLRETGIAGRTMVMMIIDEQGRVEPGSVTVQETTNEAFREPAVRVAEKMRFRPAKLDGEPVPVIIAIPIEWRMEN
jgi:TonB family protein